MPLVEGEGERERARVRRARMRVGGSSQEAVGGEGARGDEKRAEQHSEPMIHAECHARRAVARLVALVEAHEPCLERHA